jgi:tetratricopeptide (TPR) repeat protein
MDANKEKKINNLIKLATASDSVRDLPSSIKYYTQILDLDSIRLIGLINRGRALVASGEMQKGFADYTKAIKYYPCARTYCVRGLMYCYTNNYSKAFSDFAAANMLDPKFGDEYYLMSLIKIHDGQPNMALYYCNKADSLSSDNKELSSAIHENIKKKMDSIQNLKQQ